MALRENKAFPNALINRGNLAPGGKSAHIVLVRGLCAQAICNGISPPIMSMHVLYELVLDFGGALYMVSYP